MKRLVLILVLIGCAFGQGTVGGTGQGSGTGQMGILPLPTQFVLTITITGFGTVTGSPNGAGNIPLICPGTCAVSYSSGTVVTLTEAPGGGQTFSTWGGACAGSATTCVLTISANTSVNATWTGGGGTPGCSGGFCAQEPTSWQDPTICNPTGGVYDTTVTLGTTNNIGPNVGGGAIGVPYALSINGLLDAMNNWRDNADNSSQTPHFSDKWWLIKIPGGTVLHGSTYDSNSSLVSLPGKMNAGVEAAKCLVLDSTTPLPSYTMTGAVTSGVFTNGERVRQGTSLAEATLYNAVTGSTPMQLGPMFGYPDQASMFTWVGQSSGAVYTPTSTPNRFMVCDRGIPGIDGTRNPGCDGHVAGPNDRASLWEIQMDATNLAIGKFAVHAGIDLVTPANYTNHIVLRNVEMTVAPGAAQSKASSPAAVLFAATSGSNGFVFGVGPTLNPVSKHIGLENYYLHGWDPGDAGQPGAGSGNAAVDPVTGACLSWNNSGYVTVAPDGGGVNSTVTWQALFSSTINTYFGMTFKPGSIINIGGTNYTIANTTLTQNVLNGLANTTLSIVGTVTIATNTLYTQQNPPAQYAVGCGDDVQAAIQFSTDYSWREGGKVEKIHHWGSESHVSSQGFEPIGVLKEVRNSYEGASANWFEGGSPLDTANGPGADFEVRRNYFGRDLAWRTLSATATGSPYPPFGCAVIPSDSGGHPVASHNTCPFNWAIKNTMENKVAVRNLVDGNRICCSWSDGQSGFITLRNVETNSGGATGGGYDTGTGLPKTLIRDIRTSNNWYSDAPQPIQMDNRSSGQTQIGSNGGGVSGISSNHDFINNLWTNIADSAQFGKVGTGQWQWTAGGESFPCTMSYVGVVAPFTVTASCAPTQVGMHGWVTKISKDASNVVTVLKAQRTDPYLCSDLSAPGLAACVTAGKTLILTGAPGWNGSFAMSGTVGNWFADGTGGHDVIYTDNINPVSGAAVLCDNAVSTNKCSANPYVMTLASLAMKMTAIAVGDGVRAYDVGGGDTTCTANGYSAGTNSSVVAFTGTIVTGLTVVYQIQTQPSQPTANCLISNQVGLPKNLVVRNNTFLSPNYMAITAFANWYQSINNTFNDNVFISNDSGNHSHMYCTGKGGGAGSLVCWDLNTLKFYHNVMPQANAANWTGAVVNCPSGACINSFPATVNCPTATADATCVGYSGFMGGAPSVTYPTGSCVYDGSNYFNCPLMALPWANNLTIDNLSYVGSSLFSTQGVDITALKNAFARTKYVCTGACGDGSAGHHPYPD